MYRLIVKSKLESAQRFEIFVFDEVLPTIRKYGMSAQVFNDLLHFLGIQYKLKSGTWVLYQKYADCGYTKSKTYQYDEDKTAVHTYWIQSGRLFLYDNLKKYGYLPMCERLS